MNLSKFLPGLATDATDAEWEALSPEEQREIIAAEEREFRIATSPKHGPGGVRFQSNGQLRRQQIRDAKRRKRKGQAAYNRSWMAEEQRKANVRGQMNVLKTFPEDHPMYRNVARAVARKYGDPAEGVK